MKQEKETEVQQVADLTKFCISKVPSLHVFHVSSIYAQLRSFFSVVGSLFELLTLIMQSFFPLFVNRSKKAVDHTTSCTARSVFVFFIPQNILEFTFEDHNFDVVDV